MRREPDEARLQDVCKLVVAIAVIVIPWYDGDAASLSSTVNAWIVGALILSSTLWAMSRPSSVRAELFGAALGLWLLCAPLWANGIPTHHPVSVALGALVLLLSLWSAAIVRRATL
ncbi:MAG TPA: hypothetical protein VMD91_00445 [Candidatus Sulfotelmatobacter sp.]|nr:hypothetical protein [Candidatus Sulfotelmatobacter sp.]